MIVHSNFRCVFYEKIAKEHTLIIVNADVDALCASIILTYALSCDDATFSLKPVDSWTAIEQAVEEHKDQIKNLVLINCGASQSLISLPLNIKIFVLDSHRPVHLDNIYSGDLSINVLVNQAEIEEWNVPEESKIYEIESDSENEEQNDDDNTTIADESNDFHDIASQIEKRALKNQKKSNWKRNRATLIWNYYMSSWYSMSSAVFLLNLIHELGKSSPEMMWCAAVGLTSQFTDQLISVEAYTNTCVDHMRTFIRKFAPRKSIEQSRGDGVFRITFDKELVLPLYSHWSIFQSMCCDAMFVCQSSFWSQKGEANLKHILAKLGLTLAECRQDYAAMSSDRRVEVFDILEKYMDARFAAFNAYFSYSIRYNSSDFARILSLRLECKAQSKQLTLYDRFSNANFIMHHFLKFGGRETPELEKMFSRYKSALKEMTSLAFLSVNQGHIVSTSRYFLLNLQQGSYIGYLTSRHCLNLFLYLLHRAFASSNSKRKMGKPLVISFPAYSSSREESTIQSSDLSVENVENKASIEKVILNLNNNTNQWYIIIGVMPLAHTVTDIQRKNVLGRAFEHVTDEIKIDVEKEGFDSNIIKIRSDDRTKFFNSLEARLEVG